MLFHRQKVLLALLDALGGKHLATDFQKYLFLFTQLCEKDHSYDFVPYRFGCYSFQASADKQKLIEKGYLKDTTGWEIAKSDLNYTKVLNKDFEKKLSLFIDRFGTMRGKKLIKYVYDNFPYYAINSEITKEHLDAEGLEKVIRARPTTRRKPIFSTIGYEGNSVETYLNKLLENDIRMLVDVRKNPISRKYGFSKKTLSSLLGKMGIEYVHIPELGIQSSDRQELNTQTDYDKLFERYENTVLKDQQGSLQKLLDLFNDNKRIAITCYEENPQQCHRSRVALAIESIAKNKVITQHL
jgi:uncharacterized protein (DUF488 family)